MDKYINNLQQGAKTVGNVANQGMGMVKNAIAQKLANAQNIFPTTWEQAPGSREAADGYPARSWQKNYVTPTGVKYNVNIDAKGNMMLDAAGDARDYGQSNPPGYIIQDSDPYVPMNQRDNFDHAKMQDAFNHFMTLPEAKYVDVPNRSFEKARISGGKIIIPPTSGGLKMQTSANGPLFSAISGSGPNGESVPFTGNSDTGFSYGGYPVGRVTQAQNVSFPNGVPNPFNNTTTQPAIPASTSTASQPMFAQGNSFPVQPKKLPTNQAISQLSSGTVNGNLR